MVSCLFNPAAFWGATRWNITTFFTSKVEVKTPKPKEGQTTTGGNAGSADTARPTLAIHPGREPDGAIKVTVNGITVEHLLKKFQASP